MNPKEVTLGDGVVADPVTMEAAKEALDTKAGKADPFERSLRKKTLSRNVKPKAKGRSPIRRPGKGEWFRTRPDMQMPVYLLSDDAGMNELVVDDEVAEDELLEEDLCYEAVLHAACNLHGDIFLIPTKLDDSDASTSLREAVEASQEQWVRAAWSSSARQYGWSVADEAVKEPVWGDRSWREIYNASVKGRFIDSVDHVIVQRVLHAKT
jgi:hypothetical protein